MRVFFVFFLSLFFVKVADADQLDRQFIWNKFHQPLLRYAQQDAIRIADTIVFLQRKTGGWSKIIEPDIFYSQASLAAIASEDASLSLIFDNGQYKGYSHKTSTLDNGATHSHIRYLLRVAQATGDKKYISALLNGVEFLLVAQTPTGGWPQNYPNTSSFGGHVTFNDGAMIGAMTALTEVLNADSGFVPIETKKKITASITKGIEFILRSQVVIDGKKTVWCAQHNRDNYMPEGARVYELPSLSGAESVGIVKFLMRVKNPNQRIIDSIVSAIKWFESSGLDHVRVEKIYRKELDRTFELRINENSKYGVKKPFIFEGDGYDKVVLAGSGRTIWARFYDLKTQKPFFVGWDGVKKSSLSEIDYERRVGYMWYGYWPENMLRYSWPKWKAKWFKEKSAPSRTFLQLN